MLARKAAETARLVVNLEPLRVIVARHPWFGQADEMQHASAIACHHLAPKDIIRYGVSDAPHVM